MEFDNLTRVKDVQLRYAVAEPAGQSVGTLLLLQGRTEFIEKYSEVIGRLTTAGYRVVTFDWRGQGLSQRLVKDPLKGHVNSFDDYIDDLHQVVEQVVLPNLTGRLGLLAHSMGGHVGLRYLCRYPDIFSVAVFSSPMWDIPVTPGIRATTRVLLSLACMAGFEHSYVPGRATPRGVTPVFDGNPLTSDAERLARTSNTIADTPALAVGPPTLGWLLAALDSVCALNREVSISPPPIPTLIFSGEAERIVDNPTQHRLAALMPNASIMTIDDGLHELLQERDAIFELVISNTLSFFAPV